MFSLQMENGQVTVSENQQGLKTFSVIKDNETALQLVKLRLVSPRSNADFQATFAIDWFAVMEGISNPNITATIFPKITSLVSQTDGVLSVDISKSYVEVNEGSVSIKGLCFTYTDGTKEAVIF